MRGVPLRVIQELMGHASMEMTLRYAHLAPDVKNTVQVLDAPAPGSNPGTHAGHMDPVEQQKAGQPKEIARL